MTEEPDAGPVGPEKDAGTKAGRDLLDRMDRYDGLWHGAVQDIIAIEREARNATLDAVLKGLRSEDDSTQLRAIIAEVEAMRLPPSRESTPDPLER